MPSPCKRRKAHFRKESANAEKKKMKKHEKENPNVSPNARKKRRRLRLSVGKKAAIAVILGIYVLVLAATSLFVFYRPQTQRNSLVAVVTQTDSNGNAVTDKFGNVVTEIIDFDPASDVDAYNILVLGHDRAAMLTDVFMLVNIDNRDGSITIMQIPRDTWISDHTGPDGNFHYVATNKINAVFSTYYSYHRYTEGMEESKAYNEALLSLTSVLEENLFINIDYSLIMDLDGFQSIVDILGGVDLYVEQAMYYSDPDQGLYINIPAGQQTLNGAQAEGFVRYRYGYLTADLGRQNAQKQFMTALFSKAKSTLSLSNVDKLTSIADAIYTYIDTDMSAADILFFAKSLLKCDLSQMNMMTMPGNLASGYYVVNREAVYGVINTSFNLGETDIPEAAFDSNAVFNSAYDGAISYAYNMPSDSVFDNTVFNGAEVEEEGIHLPWNNGY